MAIDNSVFVFKSKKIKDSVYNLEGYLYCRKDTEVVLSVFLDKYQHIISDYNLKKNTSIIEVAEAYNYISTHKFLLLLDKSILDFYFAYRSTSKQNILKLRSIQSDLLFSKTLKLLDNLDKIVKITEYGPEFPSDYQKNLNAIKCIFNTVIKLFEPLQDLLKVQYFIYYSKNLETITAINNCQKKLYKAFSATIKSESLSPYSEILEATYSQEYKKLVALERINQFPFLLLHLKRSFLTITPEEYERKHYRYHYGQYLKQIETFIKSFIPDPTGYDLSYLKEMLNQYGLLYEIFLSYKNITIEDEKILDFQRRYQVLQNIIDRKEHIQSLIDKYQIKSIYHFTPISNLDSIMANGLLSITEMKKRNIKYVYNDSMRLDGLLNGICCSIGFPNYKLFFKFRHTNIHEKWVVLELSPDILLNIDGCRIFSENAAGSLFKIVEYPITQLEQIFSREYISNVRENFHIPTGCPINPQAELIVPNSIQVKYIKSLNFDNIEDVEKYSRIYDIQCHCNTNLFSKRSDWKNWENIIA